MEFHPADDRHEISWWHQANCYGNAFLRARYRQRERAGSSATSGPQGALRRWLPDFYAWQKPCVCAAYRRESQQEICHRPEWNFVNKNSLTTQSLHCNWTFINEMSVDIEWRKRWLYSGVLCHIYISRIFQTVIFFIFFIHFKAYIVYIHVFHLQSIVFIFNKLYRNMPYNVVFLDLGLLYYKWERDVF